MRALILAAGAALTLSACGGGDTTANTDDTTDVENLQVENLIINDTTGLDATTNMDGNMMTDMNMMGNDLGNDIGTTTDTTTNTGL